MKHFVAFSSQDRVHADTIQRAVSAASTAEVEYVPWTAQDASGSPVDRAVDGWLDDAEALVADVTYVNDNVTYEIGYAIGAGKHLRLIRNRSVDPNELKQIGLLDTLIRDEFTTRKELETLMRGRAAPHNRWARAPGNSRQPTYVLAPPAATAFTTKLFSAIKKRTRYKFRSFKAWEIGRLTAQEAWDSVGASFGIVVTWSDGKDIEARRNNQRAALIFGIARGLEVPALLIAHDRSHLPADLNDKATRFSDPAELDALFTSFRDEIQDAINARQEARNLPLALLDAIHCGDPAAENEQDDLRDYFLETEEFKRTLRDSSNLIIGRKGSGKTAIFLQVRDRVRADKRNIVVDLNPEGYQLLKLKEILTALQSLGARKEFITVFWQYVLWLEIAYKILEKDNAARLHDASLAQRYERLQKAFSSRVDTGTGDFSERLRILTDTIEERFAASGSEGKALASSQVLEIVYGTDITAIRGEVLSYLKLKGEILFLFDNLDRMRSPSGFDEADALLILGLVEAMQDIAKQFRRNHFVFRWVVFVRSDVYEFVVSGMADYGKHSAQLLEWNDPELLKRVLRRRIEASINNSSSWDVTWSGISVLAVRGRDTLDFIVEASLMRPRYIIRLFETAKRRAINMGSQKICEADYEAALEDLGWTIMEDLDLELRDVVRNSDLLLFDIAQLDGACGLPELRDAIANRVGATKVVERVIDVLLWSGAIGIAIGGKCTFIHDCGYKLQFLRSLMDRNPEDAEASLHPTLRNLFANENHPKDVAA